MVDYQDEGHSRGGCFSDDPKDLEYAAMTALVSGERFWEYRPATTNALLEERRLLRGES